jgi:uncharacterized protein
VKGIDQILSLAKASVQKAAPGAILILYGSFARGDFQKDSDIDLLILVDKEKLSFEEESAILYPLFRLERESDIVISPKIYKQNRWNNHQVTTRFFENVNREGVIL